MQSTTPPRFTLVQQWMNLLAILKYGIVFSGLLGLPAAHRPRWCDAPRPPRRPVRGPHRLGSVLRLGRAARDGVDLDVQRGADRRRRRAVARRGRGVPAVRDGGERAHAVRAGLGGKVLLRADHRPRSSSSIPCWRCPVSGSSCSTAPPAGSALWRPPARRSCSGTWRSSRCRRPRPWSIATHPPMSWPAPGGAVLGVPAEGAAGGAGGAAVPPLGLEGLPALRDDVVPPAKRSTGSAD